MNDPAIDWLLADARRQGLSVREYEKKYGIILLPSEHEIRTHETAITEAMTSTLPAPRAPESFSSGQKKTGRTRKPAPSFAPYPDNVVPFPAPRDDTRVA